MKGSFNISDLKKKFMRFMLPSVLSMIVFSMYTVVDGFFVAKFVGKEALAAVNICMPFVNFIFALAMLPSRGTATLAGIFLGRGEKVNAGKLFTFTFMASLLFSVLFYVFVRVNLYNIVSFLGAPDSLIEDSAKYISIISLFNSFFILSYIMEIMVKTDGFPIISAIGVTSSAITNIVLDYVFVAIFHLGISGAAYATGIAQAVSFSLFFLHFLSHESKLKFMKFKPDFSIYKKVLPIGLGDFISEISVSTVILLYNHFLLKYVGEFALVSYTVVSYTALFVNMTMAGVTQGVQPLISYHLGKNEPAVYNRLFKYAVFTVFVFSIAALSTIFVFADKITAIFLKADDIFVFSYTTKALKVFGLSFSLSGFNILIGGYFSAKGKALQSAVISVCRGIIAVYIALKISVMLPFEYSIWLSPTFSESACLILCLFLLYTEKNLHDCRHV